MAPEDPMADIERELWGEQTSAQRTKNIFDIAGPKAAAEIVDIMHNATNDNVRLRAAQEVVNRVLGPVGKEEQQDAIADFLKGIEHLAKESERD
jgi:hypothetical protein